MKCFSTDHYSYASALTNILIKITRAKSWQNKIEEQSCPSFESDLQGCLFDRLDETLHKHINKLNLPIDSCKASKILFDFYCLFAMGVFFFNSYFFLV